MWGNDERIHSKQWKVPFENKDIYQESFGDLKFPTSHSYLECLTWGRLIWFILIWFDLVWFDLVWFVLIWFVVVSNFLNASSGAGGWLGEVGVSLQNDDVWVARQFTCAPVTSRWSEALSGAHMGLEETQPRKEKFQHRFPEVQRQPSYPT